ncbi:MAG: DUF1320 domain-containing protein [Parvibaculaceae bacterium]|nr:DUF1320 domain-containing protein [Parvibaculaceae bacterium]
MTYATLDDMKARFKEQELIELTDHANVPPEEIDEVMVGKALADAGGLIDSYIGGRYTLPLSTVPHQLVRYCCDIAWKYLWGDSAPEAVQKNHDIAVRYLADVSAGKAKLDVQGEPAPSGVAASFDGPERLFSRDKLKGF